MQVRGHRFLQPALIFAVGLWVVSLFLPAITFVFDVEPNLFRGSKILLSGWIDLLVLQSGWLANPVFWMLVFALLPREPSRRLVSWLAAALMLFSAHTIDLFIRPDFYDVRSAHEGYYMWMAANLSLAALAFFLIARKRAAGT